FNTERKLMSRHLATFCLLLAAPSLLAQGNAVVFGAVTDPSGASVAQVDITATNEATGAVARVKSNDAGYYVFPNLRAGSYKISGQAAGFATTERLGVLVEVERRVRIDLAMQVGEVKQVLEVAGAA